MLNFFFCLFFQLNRLCPNSFSSPAVRNLEHPTHSPGAEGTCLLYFQDSFKQQLWEKNRASVCSWAAVLN